MKCSLILKKQMVIIWKLRAIFLLYFCWQSVASLKNRTDTAAIPAARKADLRARISQLEVCVHLYEFGYPFCIPVICSVAYYFFFFFL